jgi:hypothetical protein
LKESVKQAHYSQAVMELLTELFEASTELLDDSEKVPLVSKVPGKEYLAFKRGSRISRAINADLFSPKREEWRSLLRCMEADDFGVIAPHQITQTLYTAAISFCAAIDLLKDGDQKTPGTFFEYFVASFFTWRVGVEPETSIRILNADDRDTKLRTDFVFNLGEGRQKFHMPIKTSSRERSIMLWAHQRLLDGVYGIERFMGTPVLLAETKTNKKKQEVLEICLPDQWRVYQAYIAKLKRVYYLDLPATYEQLNREFPPLRIKEFGEFFSQWSDLAPA